MYETTYSPHLKRKEGG